MQCNKALEASKHPAGDEVQMILVRKGTEDEPSGAYSGQHQDQHEDQQETKPETRPSIHLKMAFGNICINKVPPLGTEFHIYPKNGLPN